MQENINELIYLYHLKDEEALRLLIRHFRPMVTKIIQYHTLSQNVQDRADFYANADISLVLCLDRYRQEVHPNFSTYYYTVIHNSTVDMLRSLRRKSTLYREDTTSLEGLAQSLQRPVGELFESSDGDTHDRVMARLRLEQLFDRADDRTRQILHWKARGCTVKETADQMGWEPRQVRYHLDKYLKRYQSIDAYRV